jgi:glycine cleavage system regulatory protein
MTMERYEVRLVAFDGDKEEVLDRREIPVEKLRTENQVAELPNREAMSLVNANIAAPINLALALNALSDNSIAIAQATQYAPIEQST